MRLADGDWSVEASRPRAEDDPVLGPARIFDLVPVPVRHALLVPVLSRPGVTLGPSLARRPEVVERIRAVAGIGEVRTSPIGGTVGPGGPAWLSLLFALRLPPGLPRPLDQVLEVVSSWLEARLEDLRLGRGRVAGAWCPGFSDLSVDGRKLVGVGFKLRRDQALARAVLAVHPPTASELQALNLCHLAFGAGVAAESLVSLAELKAQPGMTREQALELLGMEAAPAGMIIP